MPVFRIPQELVFPPPSLAEPDGLLGVGGDLSPERLLLAYTHGIFPWHDQDGEPMWWSPDPRCVLFPDKVKVSASLKRRLKRGDFAITIDRRFPDVIRQCATVARKGQRGTWITDGFIEAYSRLHALGHAHSVEVVKDGELVGGLYGVAIGLLFCGESMFSLQPDASKIALVHLAHRLNQAGFPLIDCQMANPYLISMGAEEMAGERFLGYVEHLVQRQAPGSTWE